MRKMPRLHRDLIREQLAHQAARLMAEDGIADFVLAKRKAAKQLGVQETQHLPSNQEIEAALHCYRALFQAEAHPQCLRRLREAALVAMRQLSSFRPYLTGSVLSGAAGEHSDINLTLFDDDPKAILLFLLRHNLPFEDGEWKVTIGKRKKNVPSYTLTSTSGTLIHLIVFPENARRSGSYHPATHADIATVEALLGTWQG